jgi:hypothetical protein
MYQRLIRQVAVDKRNAGPDSVQRKPKHQVFGAVGSVNCNQLSFSDTQVIHEPVADSLQVVEELLVRPRSTLEHKKYVVWQISYSMFFNVVYSI